MSGGYCVEHRGYVGIRCPECAVQPDGAPSEPTDAALANVFRDARCDYYGAVIGCDGADGCPHCEALFITRIRALFGRSPDGGQR